MSKQLPVPVSPAALAQSSHVKDLGRLADAMADEAQSPATRRSYRWAWKAFVAFCERRGLESLPATPETVRQYLVACATGLPPDRRLDRPGVPDDGLRSVGVRTIAVFRAAIAARHVTAGLPVPTRDDSVKVALKGIRRTYGKKPAKRTALGYELLQRVLAGMRDKDLRTLRDRAILAVLYSGAFRRSEAMGICVEHVSYENDVLLVFLPRSKTDKSGKGRTVPLHAHLDPETCPVRNLQTWRRASGITAGLVFRGIHRNGFSLLASFGGQCAAEMIRKRLAEAGIPAEDVVRFAGHSTRRGFITDGIRDGAPIPEMQKYTGHRTAEQLIDYFEDAGLTAEDAVSKRLQGKPRR